MRKKEKFINTLKNTDNREYFISSLDVGDVWISKDEIREKKGYKFHNFIRRHMSMPHSKAKTTKKFMDEMIGNFSNSKQQFQSITEDISRKSNHKNIYTEFSLLFLNFIKLDLANQNKIEDFVHRFGLLGDEDRTSENKENYFSTKNPHERNEPFLLWQYEQWHLSHAYDLWLQVIEIEEKKKDPKKLLKFFKPNKKEGIYESLPQPHAKTNFPQIFEPFNKQSGKWAVTNDHRDLMQVAKACVGLLIQDHLEHRVSFPVNFSDFDRPTPMFETDSLIATLWLQFLRFVRYGARKEQCRECKYYFEQIGNKKFCSDPCKVKHHNRLKNKK
jgi:hypothetical protein